MMKYLVPYSLISLIIGLIILSRRQKKNSNEDLVSPRERERTSTNSKSFKLAYASLFFATLAISSYWLMKYFVDIVYPSPTSYYTGALAVLYIVSLSLAAATGIPFVLIRIFPTLRNALAFHRNSAKIGWIIGIAYFITYLILVNQIIITGFNTPPGNYVPSPSGSYPFAFVFTAGPPPDSAIASAFYIPQVLIQLNQFFNLIVLPFEIVLAAVMSALVAATVIVTLYIIGDSEKHSCLTGATVSGLGGFFGFTATCPTCLVPTLISVLFGGVSSTVPSIYSHLSGVVLPPLISVVTLLVGLTILDFQASKTGHTPISLVTLISKKIPL
ncbi:MAG: hypothetical protein OK457_05465 [Thaumarchaeota archaeon]|nr:hypothetical protein [Nitrososphaerota archaeon]